MPLTGMKVLEVCSNLSGPVAGTIFGDLGAEVIKVEKPNGGDDARGWQPPQWHGLGTGFQAINRNKRSVTLDFRNKEDVAVLKRLAADADVFLHNMRPGAAEALGLSGPEMLALNPRMIYCAMGAYGAVGPWRGWTAYDGLAQALSSQMSANGEPEGDALLVPGGLVDKGTGMWAAIATLGALVRRATTGKGAIVATSLLETSLFWRDGAFTAYQATGTVPGRAGNTAATIVPYGVFPTGDRPIMLACAGEGLFRALAGLLGHPEWPEDPRFATNLARVANRDAIGDAINAVLATRGRDEWVDLLGGSGIPCAPILDVAEAFAHPQVQANGIFQSAPDRDMPVVSAAWTIDGVRPPVRRAAPSLGEANQELLGRPVPGPARPA
jgi:crotonobetainyl-CoA:carnitine CoA-transferase CaiB-like acyl-CoA transferase